MEIVIVGHGPSIKDLGCRIDQKIVVRCKRLIPTNCRTEDYGTRCDYLLARNRDYLPADVEFWHYPDTGWTHWNEYFRKFSPFRKYSHGLAAAFMAAEKLKPSGLYFAGCDRLMGRFPTGKSWEANAKHPAAGPPEHDWAAEREALRCLGVEIVEL